MALRLYNTKSRELEAFEPLDPPEVRMYVCGPTVYDYAHVGHARSYVAYDVLRRYLDYKGHRVRFVENITDVEDSITVRAQELATTPADVAERFTEAYLEDMDRLNVLRADAYPRVTEHIPQILDIVEALVEHDCAYAVDGDVFFRVSKSPGYGRLSHQSFEDIVVDEDTASGGRENPLDFVVWRRAKDGEPGWESPWGVGRPGWHIECYVMATEHLGPHLDIHGGGLDLIFPHHESESFIAHVCGEGDFARLWVHNGHVTQQRQKMSKSKGNYATIRDALQRADGEALRLYLLQSHYREALEFQWDGLEAAEKTLASWRETADRLRAHPPSGPDAGPFPAAEDFLAAFEAAMDDDLDTPRALGHLETFLDRLATKWEGLDAPERAAALGALDAASGVLGLLQ